MYDAPAAAAPLDGGLDFVTQMAALYKPDGKNRVLEFFYTDINKRYQILLTPNGSQVIDEGSSENFRSYTTRIETPFSVWRSIALGEISGQDALMQGKYKVLGDFGLMIKWDDLFGDSASVKPAAENGPAAGRERKTNMAVLLAPWIAVWVALAINPFWGGIAGIALAAFVPLLWFYFKPVPFEQIGIPIVAGFSLAALLGADPRIVVSISYAAFGLMWLVGAFTKTPLTAYYSANNYGGDKAFEIPLFTRTNRILTAAWGVLYLVMPIFVFFIMGTDLSRFVGLVSSVPPALMGLFTAWFQRWYPARWARG
jgi:putative sterol carrier protein